MGSLIEKLKRDGNLPLLHLYRMGTCKDFSGNGNDGTPSTGCVWGGGGLTFPADTDEVTVADAVSLRLTAGSIAALVDVRSQTATEYIVSHDNAGSGYSFSLNATQLEFTGDGTTRTRVAALLGKKMVGVTWEIGGVPTGYVDGLSVGLFSGMVAVTAEAVATEVGNWANSGRLKSPFKALAIANRILTETEMASIFAELMEL